VSLDVIEIRPHRGGWQAFEAPGVQPYWIEADAKQYAITYATERMKMRRCGEVRVFNAAGELEQTIPWPAKAALIWADFPKQRSRAVTSRG
jgi:hypothetical protein